MKKVIKKIFFKLISFIKSKPKLKSICVKIIDRFPNQMQGLLDLYVMRNFGFSGKERNDVRIEIDELKYLTKEASCIYAEIIKEKTMMRDKEYADFN